MASSESSPHAWWHCFFLYDGSKVKEEGDPTRAGICYFHPKETPMERQELLCGQLAGMLRCVSEVSGSAPDLIRFRKLKFSLGAQGEFLWVLGCDSGTPDSACKQLLCNLMGIFRFYHGTLAKAYAVHSKEELAHDWEKYIEYLLRNTSDLHRIFNSLWALDKTKIEPLLLLKAALILQSCQRVPHVLGGCILFHGQVVSTQLPPDLTAKVMIQEAETQEGELPPGVQILPVFLSKEEVAPLRDFPLEWTSGVQEVNAEGSSLAGDDLKPGSDHSSSSLERMTLYVHCVRSVTLCFLAEEAFNDPEGVFQSSLASLNGLEVHLRETQNQDGRSHAKASPSYMFGHFDSVQRILTSNFLHWDRPILRAASRIHDTFEQVPSVSEISVRSGASSCAHSLFAVRGPLLLQEAYYFPAAGSPLSPLAPPSSFGGPDPKDALFLLPGKAKQKLLKHGFNLL